MAFTWVKLYQDDINRVLEYSYGKMDQHIMDHGNQTKLMDKECYSYLLKLAFMPYFKLINCMDQQ